MLVVRNFIFSFGILLLAVGQQVDCTLVAFRSMMTFVKLSIGFLEAHFTVYQTQTSASEEFCEDIPDVTNSVFVLDYLHDFLKEMPVDFRIVKDSHNFGIFAKWGGYCRA